MNSPVPIPAKSKVPTILIADDTPANVLLLERMLADRGYRTRSVFSGTLVLEAARSDPPDLILLDIAMPLMSGYEVCGLLKLDPVLKSIPVIFISALNGTIDKVIAFSVGGVDYVTKPFQFEEVFARVQTHLKLRQLEKLRDDLNHMFVRDLRSPVAAIFDFLDLLKGQGDETLSTDTHGRIMVARLGAAAMMDRISAFLEEGKESSSGGASIQPLADRPSTLS